MADICPVCGYPKELCVCEDIAREQQNIMIFTEKRRYGKLVTIVEGINPADINLDDLAKELKTKCASGGTVKQGKIELQGDHKRTVGEVLKKMGFMVDVKD